MSLLHFAQTAVDDTFTYTTTTDPSAEAAAGMAAAVFLIIGIALLLWAIPGIITNWKLYAKAGKPGWAAIIPFYNVYVMGEIAGKTTLAIIYIVLSLTGAIPILGILTGLAALVLYIMLLVAFIQKYQASAGFWVCYILLPIVAVFLVKGVTAKDSSLGAAASPMGYAAPEAAPVPVYGQSMQPDPTAVNPGMAPQQSPVQPMQPAAPVYGQPTAPQAPVNPVYGQPPVGPAPQAPVADPSQQYQQFPPNGPVPPQPPVPPTA